MQAKFTIPAFRCVQWNDRIANGHRRHSRADLAHYAGTLVSEYGWEGTFRIVSRKGEGVRMTNARCLDFDEYFACPWALEVDFDYFQSLTCGECNCGA